MAGDDDELLTIGEVAKLDGITAKALRYYDAHNILKPAAVDPATGYRYYTPDQMLDVDVMRICIAAGMPLDSLEKFRFEDGSLDWRALLAAAQSQVDERIQQLRRLQTLFRGIGTQGLLPRRWVGACRFAADLAGCTTLPLR